MKWEEWQFSTRMAWEDNLMKWASIGTWLVLAAMSIFASIRITIESLPSSYFVSHYTVYLGIDQVEPLPWLLALIAVPYIIITANIFLSFGFFRQDNMASYALLTLAMISAGIWCIQLYYLVKINT